jgi:hypothetical protein
VEFAPDPKSFRARQPDVLVDFFDSNDGSFQNQQQKQHRTADVEAKGTLTWVLASDLRQSKDSSSVPIPGLEGGYRTVVCPDNLANAIEARPARKRTVLTKRQAIQDYEDRLRAIKMHESGLEKSEVAKTLGRSEKWVQRWWRRNPAMLTKPKGVEQLDMRGFRELKYWRGYLKNNIPDCQVVKGSKITNSALRGAHQTVPLTSLYHKVLQSYDLQQAHSTSKRELVGSGGSSGSMRALSGGSSYFQRTLRLCVCGREVHKMPDDTKRINDDRVTRYVLYASSSVRMFGTFTST